MAETTVKPSAGGAPVDDEAELAQKQKDLATVNAQLKDASTRTAALAADIKVLEGRIADVKKATDAYSKATTAQQKELDDDKALIGQKWLMASAGAKDQVPAIEDAVKAVDKDIATQTTNVGALQKAADKAQQDWDAAAADSKAKQDAYAAQKQTQKNTDDQLKEIKGLIDQAVKAEVQGDVVSMYFLLEEATAAAKAVNILAPAEYDKNVKAAQAAAEASKTTAVAKKADLDTQNKALADAQGKLKAAVDSRRATILDKLKTIKAPAAAPAPAAPAPAPAAPVAPVAPGSPPVGAGPS